MILVIVLFLNKLFILEVLNLPKICDDSMEQSYVPTPGFP